MEWMVKRRRAVSSLALKGKPSQQNILASSAPLTSTATSSGMDGANVTPIHVSATANLSNSTDHPRVFPASTDGLGEVENGIHKEQDSERDGWDDIEPLRAKLLPTSANIEAAQKQPVSKPKPQVPISRLKGTSGTSKEEDGDLWNSVPDRAPKSTSKPATAKASWVVCEADPRGAVTTQGPSSNKSLNLKSRADDDLWASIAAPPPATGMKTLSAGRGRGMKPAASKLGASRINTISPGVN